MSRSLRVMVQFDHMRDPFEMYITPRKTLLGLNRQLSHFYNLACNDPWKVTRISYGEPFIYCWEMVMTMALYIMNLSLSTMMLMLKTCFWTKKVEKEQFICMLSLSRLWWISTLCYIMFIYLSWCNFAWVVLF